MDKKLDEFLRNVDISDVARGKIRSLYKLKKKLDVAKYRLNFSLGIFLSCFLFIVLLVAVYYRGDMYALYLDLVEEWLLLGVVGVVFGTYYMGFPKRYKKKKDEADDHYHDLRKEIAHEINEHYNVWSRNEANTTELYRLIKYLGEEHDINIKYQSKK